MIKLSEQQIMSLAGQPESGMGYQIVEVKYPTGIKKATVYNSELLLWETEPRTILMESYDELIKSASVFKASLIESIRVIPPPSFKLITKSILEKFAEITLGKPATEGEPKWTEKDEVYMRFTAYRNDHRITPNNGLMPGTYATTAADAKNVKTGSDAVERYALPDPKPAIYRFRIDPRENTVYRQGVVQPAFGHKGGGVEVIFDNGTHDNTVSGLAILPS